MKTKICPSCGAEHNLSVDYCGCGHKWKRGSVQSDVQDDPMHGCCTVETISGRCHYPGVHSDSTTGGDNWKCREHYLDSTGDRTEEIVIKSHDEIPRADYSLQARKEHSTAQAMRELSESKYINDYDRSHFKAKLAGMINARTWRNK